MSEPSVQRLGDYELRREIGRGGMGVVYEAWHPRMGRRVAVKTFVFGPAVTAKERARFNVEIQAAARLQHPGIATVFESGESAARPFYAMEYVDGGSLSVALRDGPWEARQAATLVRDAALAVEYAHQQAVIHRDLKPANILLDSDGRPKIVDFGLAKCLDSGTDLTRTGQIMGTAAYMAPEQALGLVHTIGRPVDIYALGAILYEMLTGRPPFQSPDAIQTLSLVATADPISPRLLQPSVPRDLEVICLKCLHKVANRRYASAQELADDLSRFLNGEAILARPVGRIERTWKWMKRRPAMTGLMAIAVLFVITLVIGLIQIRAALTEAEENLSLFHSAVEKLSVDLADSLSEIPESEGVRVQLLESARELYQTLSQLRPRDNAGRFLMAHSIDNLGRISRQLGRTDEARTAFQEALDQFDILLASDPDNVEYLMGAAAVHNNLRDVAATPAERIRELELALSLMPASNNPDYQRQRGVTYNNLSLALLAQGDAVGAELQQQEALSIRRQLVEDHPDVTQYTVDLAVSYNGLAQIAFAHDDLESATADYLSADALLAGVETELDREGRFTRARVCANVGACFESQGILDQALERYTAASAITTQLCRDFPSFVEYEIVDIQLQIFEAQLLRRLGDRIAAHERLTVARERATHLAATGNANGASLLAQCTAELDSLEFEISPETRDESTPSPVPSQ